MSSGHYTFLPELYDIFGKEATVKFMEIFSGTKIAVPKAEKLERLAKSVEVYVRVERAAPRHRASLITQLADEMDLSRDRILDMYTKTKVKLEEEHGFRVTRRTK